MSAVFSLISLLKLHSFTGQVYALTFFFLEISHFFFKEHWKSHLPSRLLDCSLLSSWHHCIYPAMLQRHDLEVWTVWSSRMNTMNALLVSSSSPARSLARAFNAPTINQNYSTDD